MRRPLSLLVLFLLSVCALSAQPKGRVPPNYINPADLNKEEGAEVIERFRNARLSGDYSFIFELKNTAPGKNAEFHRGQIWGSWNDYGPVSRVEIFTEGPRLTYFAQNGKSPWMYRCTMEEGMASDCVKLTDESYATPLVGDLQITPFELQMPFVYWPEYVYEGSTRVKGRPAYTFILYPPEKALVPDRVAAVRITIDADFNALLRAETLDAQGRTVKSLRILSFKKAGETWIVKSIDFVDEGTRAKTRFNVIAAAVQQQFDSTLFEPGSSISIRVPAQESFTFFE